MSRGITTVIPWKRPGFFSRDAHPVLCLMAWLPTYLRCGRDGFRHGRLPGTRVLGTPLYRVGVCLRHRAERLPRRGCRPHPSRPRPLSCRRGGTKCRLARRSRTRGDRGRCLGGRPRQNRGSGARTIRAYRYDRRRPRVVHHRARGLVGYRGDLRPPAAAASALGPPSRCAGADIRRCLRPRGFHATPARAGHRRPTETGTALHPRRATRRPGGPDIEIGREVERDVVEGRYHTGRAAVVQVLARRSRTAPAGALDDADA